MANFDKELVIETTHWGADLFSNLRKRYPNKQKTEIYKMMISHRYNLVPDENAEKFLLAAANDMKGLRALLAIVLDVETGMLENNSDQVNKKILDIIDSELGKYDIENESKSNAKSTYLAGITWVLISLLVAFLGVNLTGKPGFLGGIAWVLNVGGFGFAFLSIKHLYNIYKDQKKRT